MRYAKSTLKWIGIFILSQLLGGFIVGALGGNEIVGLGNLVSLVILGAFIAHSVIQRRVKRATSAGYHH